MRKIFGGLAFILCVVMSLSLMACSPISSVSSDDIIRIHIRANSNSNADQSVKLNVRDAVVEYITPLVSSCDSSDEVKVVLQKEKQNIINIADEVLGNNSFSYCASVTMGREYFPSRDYGGLLFPAGEYEALVLRLGEGTGNNWWCVAYPPLCFVGESNASDKVVYRSKLVEIITNLIGK